MKVTNTTDKSITGIREPMASEIENVEIAAKIMSALLSRMKEEVDAKLSSGADMRELLGRDGIAEAAVKLVQTALKLEELRKNPTTPNNAHEKSCDPLTDEDMAVLRAFLLPA